MRTSADMYLAQVNKSNQVRDGFRQTQRLLSLMVVFVVFWCLKLTGITMAGEAFCGMEEHVHTESCGVRELICELEEVEAHVHTAECLHKELSCKLTEQEGHTHGQECVGRKLLCTKAVSEGHTHGADCSQKTLICTAKQENAHSHSSGCYTQVVGCGQEAKAISESLVCGLTETTGHSHNAECYLEIQICNLEEDESHAHGEGCFQRTQLCTQAEEAGHTHTDSCYVQVAAQEHEHDASCMVDLLICEQTETAGHSHGTDCYAETMTCEMEETAGHVHDEACYSAETGYICGLEEVQAHFHTDDCYTVDKEKYVCGLEETEGHKHEGKCYNGQEACTLEEHTHTPNCYSDTSADLETSADWEKTFTGLICATSNKENVILMAMSQLDVEESTRNFEVDEFGVRRGITRYGQWYGNPYGDWSAMFVSFCLEYAGVQDVPRNAGVEAMRLEWETERLYTSAEEHVPAAGQLLFLDKDEDGEADSVAIVTDRILGEENEDVLIVVEGDISETVTQIGTVKLHAEENAEEEAAEAAAEESAVMAAEEATVALLSLEDAASAEEIVAVDRVAETMYAVDDPAIMGYGLVPEGMPQIMMMSPAPRAGEKVYLGRTINYSNNMFTSGRNFVIYAKYNDGYYAFVSNPTSGMESTVTAVPIEIGSDSKIYTDIDDPSSLLWQFTRNGNTGSNYYIQNVSTGRYLHPGGDYGVVYDGNWPTALQANGTGAKFVHTSNDNNVGIYYNGNQQRFEIVRNKRDATTLYFGLSEYVVPERCAVWLDGTDGDIASLRGSPDQKYNVERNSEFTLPTQWTSPSKYSYKLRGWYDVTHSQYYLPGAVVPIEETTVFYADWVASTYDIGVYNAQVANTVSTDSFITTHMFDYNYLFNIHSSRLEQTLSASGHTDNWHMVTTGNVAHGGQPTFDFIFVDNDTTGRVCIPHSRSDRNVYPGAGIVTPGIYSSVLAERLFATDNCYNPETKTGILGKTYLGTGDHLFQIMDDPTDEHYGYYYYDSARNAASYNQSNRRFYVYEYLEATSDAIGSTYSDFLPLNSPYVNTNGKSVGTYSYAGVDGEYQGIPHYRYDSKYDSGNHNSVNNVTTDYAYGMRSDIQFYLPNDPGKDGNKDLYGNDMQFQFSGDDDLWVLIDGKLVLDIGGIHGAEDGVIDFSTGQVTVQGKAQKSLVELGIGAGDHTLSVLYLERGSSLSNCSIYFNLAPRFGLVLQKEDVLTQQLLDGTKFTIYEDFACTKGAVLWESEEAYQRDRADGTLDAFRSTFTVQNGIARIWGLGSGNTYYIKETGAPTADGYGLATGLIRLTLKKDGQTNYKVDVIPDAEENAPSNGFTVHGVKIDEATKTVYITATNAPETVTETTTVQVLKKWGDSKSHSDDYITAYLSVTDPDGTVRRIREVVLSEENNWNYTWTNLPKYDYDKLAEVAYGIEESYESGYYSTVIQVTELKITSEIWAESASFAANGSYFLRIGDKYLSTTAANNTALKLVDQDTAKNSVLATWKATVSGTNNNKKVKLTNGASQILTYNTSNRYFYARTGTNSYQNFPMKETTTGFQLYYTQDGQDYYMSALNEKNGWITTTTDETQRMTVTPMTMVKQTQTQQVKDWAYEITNTPLAANNETSMAVQKHWEIPAGYSSDMYQEFAVTVRLMANGVDTGRSITLTLKNNWFGIFQGLPYKDVDGNVIVYEVEEIWEKAYWATHYGEIKISGNGTPQYETTITNTYHPGGPELPSTGTAARMLYVLCGGSMMLTSLVYGIILRRKRERRTK